MSHLDTEINIMRARLNALEEQKKINAEIALQKKNFPLNSLENIIIEKKKSIERNSYSKSLPLARFYNQEQVGYLEPILDVLKNIQKRLDIIEKKELQGTLLCNLGE